MNEDRRGRVVYLPEPVVEHCTQVRESGKVGLRIPFSKYFQKARSFSNFRRRNPIAPNQADIVNWILWDRYTAAAATTTPANITFFTTPQGGTKTKNDTNLEQVQRLPDPQWFNATQLAMHFSSQTAPADFSAFLNSYFLEFWVGQKIYAEGPIPFYPGGAGVHGGFATTAASTTLQAVSNGLPQVGNMYDLRLPGGLDLGDKATDGLIGITILQGQNFKVEFKGTPFLLSAAPAGVGANIVCALHGILSRGVQ